MLRRRFSTLLFVAVPLLPGCGLESDTGDPAADRVVRINGSSTVNPVMTEIANILRDEEGLSISVDVQGGSSGGVSGAADGSADIGMSSKPLSEEDQRRFGDADLRAVEIGSDAVALAVERSVIEGGVRRLTRSQLRQVYEKRITNWSELGGSDLPIVFFDKEPGRGTWEVFAHWLYPDSRPPTISHSQVGGNEEARTKSSTTPGAITQLSVSWVDQSEGLGALALVEDDVAVEPTPANIASGLYGMRRPLLLLTSGPPDPIEQRIIDFALSERGQSIVEKHGYLPLPETNDAK